MGRRTTRFKVVLFDLGNTLLYFKGDWPSIFELSKLALLQSLNSNGIPLEDEFIVDFSSRMEAYYQVRDIDFLEVSTRNILETTLRSWGYVNIKEDLLSNALSEMYAVTQQHWLPETDASDTLKSLYRSGYRLSIISNAADDENTQVLVDKLGVRKYLECVMSSAFAGVRKPNPEIFLKVLSYMDASPEQVVMVGNSLLADIAGWSKSWNFLHLDQPQVRIPI